MEEVDNILRIFRETREAIHDQDSLRIKKLSDQTVHTATIYQDPDNIIVAVLVYSISKIIEREQYRQMGGWPEFYEVLQKNIDQAISNLEKQDVEAFRLNLGKIRNAVNKISGNLRIYIQDVFIKSGINKAFKLYEHGISSEKTAELLGVSLWDLASYIGQSEVSEAHLNQTMSSKARIKIAKEIFE